jgi:hypothetical protein
MAQLDVAQVFGVNLHALRESLLELLRSLDKLWLAFMLSVNACPQRIATPAVPVASGARAFVLKVLCSRFCAQGFRVLRFRGAELACFTCECQPVRLLRSS